MEVIWKCDALFCLVLLWQAAASSWGFRWATCWLGGRWARQRWSFSSTTPYAARPSAATAETPGSTCRSTLGFLSPWQPASRALFPLCCCGKPAGNPVSQRSSPGLFKVRSGGHLRPSEWFVAPGLVLSAINLCNFLGWDFPTQVSIFLNVKCYNKNNSLDIFYLKSCVTNFLCFNSKNKK